MKHPRVAFWGMAAVHVLLFVVPLSTQALWKYSAWWILWSWGGISLCQGYLLGLWAALGGKPTPLRAVIVAVLAAIWSSLSWQYISPLTDEVTRLLIWQMFLAMAVMLLARLLGLELEETATGVRSGHFQFSIQQALAWMTALAVFMAATHYLRFGFYNLSTISMPVMGIAVALGATWLVFGDRWITARSFAVVVLIILGTLWMAKMVHRSTPWWCCTLMLGFEAAATAASLLILRLAGYRLAWHWPFRRSQP